MTTSRILALVFLTYLLAAWLDAPHASPSCTTVITPEGDVLQCCRTESTTICL